MTELVLFTGVLVLVLWLARRADRDEQRGAPDDRREGG